MHACVRACVWLFGFGFIHVVYYYIVQVILSPSLSSALLSSHALRIEPKASCILGKHSIAATPPALSSNSLFCLGLLAWLEVTFLQGIFSHLHPTKVYGAKGVSYLLS